MRSDPLPLVEVVLIVGVHIASGARWRLKCTRSLRETGRRGLPAETVLRCALLKQQRQLGYEELAFHLEDSAFRGRGGLMTFKIGSQLRRATSCLPAKRVRQLS